MNPLLVLDVSAVGGPQICDQHPIGSRYEQRVRLGHGVLRTEHRNELSIRVRLDRGRPTPENNRPQNWDY